MDKSTVDKLKKAGQLAKATAYRNLLESIRAGKTLKPGELKLMKTLEAELGAPEESQAEKPDRIQGYEEAAAFCGFSKRTLSYHIGRGKIRQNEDGSFDVKELEAFLASKGRKVEEPGSLGEQKAAADLRFRLARAASAEVALARETGALISRDEVQSEWSSRNIELKTALLAWANKLPPLLHGRDKREIGTILRDEVYYLLDRFSRTGKWTPQVSSTREKKASSSKRTGRGMKR